MLIGILVVAILLFFLVKSFLPQNDEVETETLYCGPNNSKPVKVYKNPSKAFPVFAQDYTVKLNAGMSVIDSIKKNPKVNSNISLDLGTKVTELREKLNQESSRMEMIMKSNFLAFNANPCDSSISRKYYDLLNAVVEKNHELDLLMAQLTLPTGKGGNTRTEFTLVTDTSRIKDALSGFEYNYKFEK
jgi:hypothetical protein